MKRELILALVITLVALAGVIWTASSAHALNCGGTIRGRIVLAGGHALQPLGANGGRSARSIRPWRSHVRLWFH